MPKTFVEWMQLIATVVSPLLLAWLGFANDRLKDNLDRQNALQKQAFERQDQMIARQDALLKERFERSGTRFDNTEKIFTGLADDDPKKRRLAVLTALAFIHENQLPEFMLSVLAINDSKDPEVGIYLRQGITDLTLSATVPENVRRAAFRALEELAAPENVAKLSQQGAHEGANFRANAETVTEVAGSLVSQSISTTASPQDQQLAKDQLQQLAPALSVLAISGPDGATKARAASLLEKVSVGDGHRVEQAVSTLAAHLPAGTKFPPRVYLHIVSESQRPTAETLKRILIQNGDLVPGIQLVGGSRGYYIPNMLEVRYFAQQAQPLAEAILKMVKENGAKDGRISATNPTSTDLKISPDIESHFEIWAGKSSF